MYINKKRQCKKHTFITFRIITLNEMKRNRIFRIIITL